MHDRGIRVPVALGVAVVAAGAATLALRPRSGLIQPAPGKAQASFSAAGLDRIHDYVGPRRALAIGGLVVTGATLAFVALRPPRRVRRSLERAAARPRLGSLVTGAALVIVVGVVTLPLGAVAHQRAVDYGLSTQGWGGWAGDLVKSEAIGAVLAGGGAALLVALMRRFPRRWWMPGGVAVIALGALFTFIAPVVLEPIFNKFTPLPPGGLRSDVLDLARRSNVDVGQVYKIDASRRTTRPNPDATGLGPTKHA